MSSTVSPLSASDLIEMTNQMCITIGKDRAWESFEDAEHANKFAFAMLQLINLLQVRHLEATKATKATKTEKAE